MELKEKLKEIVKEHKFLKEQLVMDIVSKAEGVPDEDFLKTTEQVFGIKMDKNDFKKRVAKGELTVEKLQEFASACETIPTETPVEEEESIEEEEDTLEEGEGSEEEDEMKYKQESDGADGEHTDPEAPKETPTQPSQAGAGVDGDEQTNQAQKDPAVTSDGAGDGSEGDHKEEGMDEEDTQDEAYEGDEPTEEEKSKLEQMEDDMEDMKEAMEGDLVNLLKDLIAKVHELEAKMGGVEGSEEMGEEEPVEPQPPITQEGINGAKPLTAKQKNDNIARRVGQSFFESRSKR